MPRPFVPTLRRRPVTSRANVWSLGAAGVLAALALTACGTEPAQSKEHASTAGVDTSIGDVLIRNASVTLVGDSDAVLTMVLYNEGTGTDTLSSVSSSAASSVTLPAGGGPGGGLGTPSASADAGSTAGVTLPTGAAVFLNTSGHEIQLSNLKTSLIGATVPVTLAFSTAGSITLALPIVGLDRSLAFATPTPTSSSPSATASPATGSASPGASTSPSGSGSPSPTPAGATATLSASTTP